MKVPQQIRQRSYSVAFTRLELVIVVLVVTVLVLLIVPGLVRAREKSRLTRCANNLVQIGTAMTNWAAGHTNSATGAGEYAPRVPTNYGGSLEFADTGQVFQHFRAMSNELGSTAVLVCPSDSRQAGSSWLTLADTNLSYFISLGADPRIGDWLLTGDRHLDSVPPRRGAVLEVSTNTLFRWRPELHQGNSGNVVLSDGSVLQVPASSVGPDLVHSVHTNRLKFP